MNYNLFQWLNVSYILSNIVLLFLFPIIENLLLLFLFINHFMYDMSNWQATNFLFLKYYYC
jgi:hypothetical protein